MFAPTEDRDAPGGGFTHKVGDVVTISSPMLGSLVNRVEPLRPDRAVDLRPARVNGEHHRAPPSSLPTAGQPLKPNYIDGAWNDQGTPAANINPSNTADMIEHYVHAGADQAEQAIASAAAAAPAWALSNPQARADALDKIGTEILARKQELGTLLSREEGKTLPEGVGEAARAGAIFKFYAQEALRLRGDKLASVRPGLDVEVTREPVGVVGIIAPWNFPIAIPAWKIAPALAYGNCVLIKPAELVPGSAWALAEIISRAGLPAGVFNLVMGRGSVVGQALLNDRRVNAISFTGSVATGAKVAEAALRRFAKVQIEMGGKNPLVVLADADLDTAVHCAMQGSFYSTGQRCTASSRLIVEKGIYRRSWWR